MIKTFSICGLLLLTACGGANTSTQETKAFIQPTTPEEVSTHLNFLASDELAGREAGTAGVDRAGAYIAAFFEKNGIQPFYPSYRDTLSNFEPTTYNIVGYLPGTDPSLSQEFILIGAHYDHIGQGQAVGDDTIANGANDNATGTITVMQLAKHFAQKKNNKRPLVFALFTAEEKGLLGSRHMAARMKKEGVTPYLVLNFEMTGVPMAGKSYTTYMTGYELSDLAEKMNVYAGSELVGFLPTAKTYGLFKRSDNYPFYEEFGAPAHTFSTFDFTNFDHYHQVGDEAGIINVEHMTALINAFASPIEQLCNDNSKVKKS